MGTTEQEYLKQLNEANKELQVLKRERANLLRKLKGVRAARKQDLARWKAYTYLLSTNTREHIERKAKNDR